MRCWFYLFYLNTYESRHTAIEIRKVSSSLYLLIQGSRGNPGLGRYRARKETEAGAQTVMDTHHHHLHQALQINLQLANPILKKEGGQMKPYRRQDLEAETKGCPGEGLSFSGLWLADPCASVHPSPKPHMPPTCPSNSPPAPALHL